jgi:hypothetical protein
LTDDTLARLKVHGVNAARRLWTPDLMELR